MLFPKITELLQPDKPPSVRENIASQIPLLVPCASQQSTRDQLLSLVSKILNKKEEEPDVVVSMLWNVGTLLECMDAADALKLFNQQLLTNFMNLKQWRIKQLLVTYIPHLSCHSLGIPLTSFTPSLHPPKSLSSPQITIYTSSPSTSLSHKPPTPTDYFNFLITLTLRLLSDDVAGVRDTACISIRQIAEIMQSEWTRSNILPQLFKLTEHKNYLLRNTAFTALAV